jgi:hypothetical protein
MKIAGIILLTLGIVSTLGSIIGTASGHSMSFSGLVFVVLGAFLLSRAKKKKEEKEKIEDWAEGDPPRGPNKGRGRDNDPYFKR